MTDLTTRRPTGRPGPEEPPGHADAAGPSPAAPAPPDPPQVELARLLALVRLTPAQALEVGAGVLGAVLRQPVPDGAADDEGLPGRLVVTAEGQVLTDPAGARGGRAGAVLADVLAATRVPDPAVDPEAAALLDALERAVADLPATGAGGAARRLQEAAAGVDRPAVRAQLGALVGAVGTVLGARPRGGTGGGGAARPGTPRPAARPDAAGVPAARTGSTGRRVGAWLLSLLVLAGVAGLEVVFLRDHVAADVKLLLDAGRGGDQSTADPAAAEPALPTPAPAAAGIVTGLDLRPLAACEPGAPCTVRLVLRVAPAAEPEAVTWTYQVVDRCTGDTTSAPGGTVTVPPQGDSAAVVGVVPLPPARAVAVFAVTGAPAVAASPPVVAGSCSSGDGG